ncbi:MAG TPA: hypothetical protein VGN42_05645 [Pirellulales bacterium]|nr:hypothetical protein [Pirellulales bacterium]
MAARTRHEEQFDWTAKTAENSRMSTETVPTEVMSDLEAVCAALAARRPLDPVVARRVQERAERVKEEIRRRGVTDIAVSLVREIRDEE